MATFKLSGFSDLDRDFRNLDFAERKTVGTRAIRAAAKIVSKRAAELAPRDPVVSGVTLAEEIMETTAGQKNDINVISIEVGPTKEAFYGGFQELGTAHHPAQPFLVPAFEETEDEAMGEIASVLREEIDKALLG